MATNKFYPQITENEFREIRLLLKRGLTIAVLSQTFGFNMETIEAIKNLKSWRNIKP